MHSKIIRILALLLAIAIVFIVSKEVFNYSPVAKNVDTKTVSQDISFKLKPLSDGFSVVASGGAPSEPTDPLKNYPDPTKFKVVRGDDPRWYFSGVCREFYYTILVYPLNIDYRRHPNASIFNEAFICPLGGVFSAFINTVGIGRPGEKYYTIIADQGKDGPWVNPR